jgi:hypothetical protein
LIGGCFEKTSEEVKEIDPRFVELPDNVAVIGAGGAQQNLLDDIEGDRVVLKFELKGLEALPVDVDIRGEKGENMGKWTFPAPGLVEKEIPAGIGQLQLQAFQDLNSDGPTDDDPFGWLDIDVQEESFEGLVLEMESGGKLKHAVSMGHVGSVSSDLDVPTVQLKMLVRSEFSQSIDLDFRGKSGLLYKSLISGPGNQNLSVPAGLGEVQLQAFQDLTSDGPSDDDPFAWLSMVIGQQDPDPVVLDLLPGAKLNLAQEMGHEQADLADESQAFSDHDGEWTLLRGQIEGGLAIPVQVDFRVPDANEPGGNRFLGRTRLPAAGRYQLQVPRNMGTLILEVFQDPENDGPSDDDPYTTSQITVGDVDSLRKNLRLEKGTRGQPSAVVEEEPGSNSEQAPSQQQAVFEDLGSNPVEISGTILLGDGIEGLQWVDLDLFVPDAQAPGGRRYLGKLKFEPGPFLFKAPQNYGILELEAFGDLDGDGPTPGDPFGRFSGNPLEIGSENQSGIEILIQRTGQ